MAKPTQSPAQLRSMFGKNLRILAARYDSVSDLSRQLGINRTQFNRYLAGESFPRPDVLARMCNFFNVDARVLLEPVENISADQDPIMNPFLRDFVGARSLNVPQTMLPDGFYRFSRRSFVEMDAFVVGLVHVSRDRATTFLRGYEAREAMHLQDLPDDSYSREYRGFAMQQEDGLVIIVSRRNAMTSSFNYLARVASFKNNFWMGYVTRTMPENLGGLRATRLVYEHLGPSVKTALAAARTCGFCSEADLIPFHRRLLRPEDPFV